MYYIDGEVAWSQTRCNRGDGMKIISIILIICMTGCSALASNTQQFSVTASPDTARIMINGEFAGRGTATSQVKRDSAVSVQVSADNCETMYRAVGHHMSGLGVLDIVGGVFLLVPFFGLAAAGSRNLDEESIHFTLPCKDPETGEIIQHEAIEIKKKGEPIQNQLPPARGEITQHEAIEIKKKEEPIQNQLPPARSDRDEEEVKIAEKAEKAKEIKVVEEVKEVEEVGTIKKTSFKSGEAINLSTGSSKQVSSSPEDWTDAVVTVSAGMGHGSGFVISENLILTNHHVVGESKSVAIKFSNGLQLIGKVIASNLGRDVAVVKVDATLPKYFRLSKNTPVLGADVYAIGTPLDEKLHSTISRGIISALRVVQNKTLIQSDINIHPGSSGGPLLYKSGTVVGIAVSKFAVNKTSQGISFFIPIDDALKSLKVI